MSREQIWGISSSELKKKHWSLSTFRSCARLNLSSHQTPAPLYLPLTMSAKKPTKSKAQEALQFLDDLDFSVDDVPSSSDVPSSTLEAGGPGTPQPSSNRPSFEISAADEQDKKGEDLGDKEAEDALAFLNGEFSIREGRGWMGGGGGDGKEGREGTSLSRVVVFSSVLSEWGKEGFQSLLQRERVIHHIHRAGSYTYVRSRDERIEGRTNEPAISSLPPPPLRPRLHPTFSHPTSLTRTDPLFLRFPLQTSPRSRQLLVPPRSLLLLPPPPQRLQLPPTPLLLLPLLPPPNLSTSLQLQQPLPSPLPRPGEALPGGSLPPPHSGEQLQQPCSKRGTQPRLFSEKGPRPFREPWGIWLLRSS